MRTTGLAANSYPTAVSRQHDSWAGLWLPLVGLWLLMVFTIGVREDEGVRELVPEPLLQNLKIGLRLLLLAIGLPTLAALWHHPQRPAVNRNTLPILLFVAWGLLSTLWSPLRQTSLAQAGGTLLLVLLATLIAVHWNGERVTSSVLCCVNLGLLSCSLILLTVYFGLPDVGAMTRSQGGLLHPTNSSSTASLGILLMLGSRLIWNWGWSRTLCMPALLIHLTVLFISTNRLAMALTMVLAPLICVMYCRKVTITAVVVAASLVATAYLTVDPGLGLLDKSIDAAASRAQRDQSQEELASVSGREEMWTAIWGSFRESPLIGHGYFVTSRTGKLYVWYEWGNWTAHNTVLQLLVTTGVIGFGLMACGLARIAWLLARGAAHGRISSKTASFFVIVATWYAVWGLLNESFAGPVQPESITFYALLGVAAGTVSHRGVEQ